LKKTIQKYRRENFSIQIVQECSTEEELLKFKKSRIGKGTGKNNSMSNPENRKKVSDSKKGRKRIYRKDGTYYMSPRIS
jgi:hypothetical protein